MPDGLFEQLGKGAFGTVRIGVCTLGGNLIPVAIKTIVAYGQGDAKNFYERVDAFETEARCLLCAHAHIQPSSDSRKKVHMHSHTCMCRVSWLASAEARKGNQSKICIMHGIAFEVKSRLRVHLHLVLERVDGGRDLHEWIHQDHHWDKVCVCVCVLNLCVCQGCMCCACDVREEKNLSACVRVDSRRS